MFKRFALPIAFVLATSFAHADKKTLVDEMIKLNELDKQIGDSLSQISKNPPNPFKGKLAEDQEKFDEAYVKTVKEELDKITKDTLQKVLTQLAGLYDKHFSEEDLSKIVEFLKSPAGLKQKNEMPKIMEEMSEVMHKSRETVMPAMQKAIEKGVEEAKKKVSNTAKIDEILKERDESMKKQQEMMEKFKKMQEEKANKKPEEDK